MISVMSFNLRMETERDGENAWPYRRQAAVETVLKYQPDVLGVQEGLPQMIAYLDASLDGYARIGRGRDIDGGEHTAVYLKKSSLEIISSGDFWLSDTPDVPGSKHWGNNCVRIVTYAVVRDRCTGRELLAVNTHLDHESTNAREKGALAIDSFVRRQSLPAILTGDMNDIPSSVPIQFWTGKAVLDGRTGLFQDAGIAVGSDKGTFHGYGQVENPHLIDYILFTKDFQVESYQVVEDRPDGVFISDHYPIVACLQFAKES